jgi:hypothetical protein
MRRARGAVAVAVLSAAGLLVSLVVAVPRLSPERDFPRSAPAAGVRDSAAAASTDALPPRSRSLGDAPDLAAVEAVGRRGATRVAHDESAEPTPVRLSLDGVDVSLPVRPVGVGADGQMALPADPAVLGWYRFGPAPAKRAPGSAVLAGHLDSRRFGLGPLVRLRQSKVGDPVRVVLSDGTVTAYEVAGVRRFDRRALPAALFSRSGPPRLRIVTCGGAFDDERGGYQKNLVVTAVPR